MWFTELRLPPIAPSYVLAHGLAAEGAAGELASLRKVRKCGLACAFRVELVLAEEKDHALAVAEGLAADGARLGALVGGLAHGGQ